ncbi:MAG TPA: hypothetical protein VNZ64_02415 [Candidatus Acidoferrum sp.]|jgi:hypothetical protein|nr:hypothetical protein [Candidatus Acidoferrum sp.]
MESSDIGARRSAGQECPALNTHSETAEEAGETTGDGGDGLGYVQATEEEVTAITRFLRKRAEFAPASAGVGRAAALAWAGLKLAGVVLVAAGVGVGLGDGDELDSGGSCVAHQPGKSPQRGRSTQVRERGDGKLPGSGGGAGGGSGDGGPGGRPECEVRAMMCEHRVPDGQCRLLELRGVPSGRPPRGVRNEEVVDVDVGTAEDAENAEKGSERMAVVKAVEAAMARFEGKLEAVARGNCELRRENEELRTLQRQGFLKFALRVDGEDFRAFAVIMALGNRKAAADFLEVPHRSFYDRVEKWSGRGRDYQRMARFIDWRKKSSRRIKLRLEDSVQSGEPNDGPENPETVGEVLEAISAGDNRDYPAVLAQVMEALKAQNVKNWPAVRDELVGMIREEVAQ